MDYAMPRADGFIGFKTLFDTSVKCKTNLLGAKGVGELGTIGATPVVANAVVDALAADGERLAAEADEAAADRVLAEGEARLVRAECEGLETFLERQSELRRRSSRWR